MTAKRFTYDSKTVSILKDGEFWLDGNVDTACNHSEICNELNALNDENEQLRHDATILIQSNQDYRKENEQLKQRNKRLEEKIQRERISFMKTHERWSKEAENKIKELSEENERLKSQLYCDEEEGVCNICKHHYLVKDDEAELGYYNSRCKKGHYECARVSLKYCEDFEKELK